MDPSGSQSRWQVLARFGCTSASCCIADGICLPMDMIKVRMQLQTGRLGVMEMTSNIVKKEGFGAFFAGYGAALLRQASYGGLCFGSYPFVRDALSPASGPSPFSAQLAAGALAGGGAAALANPFDVVKVRLQGDGRRLLEGKERRWPQSALRTLSLIYRTEGLRTLYTAGLSPNITRAAVVNGCGIAVYDSSKGFAQSILEPLPIQSDRARALAERFLAALAGGVATSLAGCPFDVVKTRLMTQSGDKPKYSGPLDCILQTARKEGPLALWKGLLPVYGRQAPFNLLNYLIMEQLIDLFVR